MDSPRVHTLAEHLRRGKQPASGPTLRDPSGSPGRDSVSLAQRRQEASFLEAEAALEEPVPEVTEEIEEVEVEVEAAPEPPPAVWIPTPPQASSVESLGQLRRLLGGDQNQRLQDLEERLSEPEWLEESLPYYLPRAFQRAPDRVSEALYPILGPAIRKAITNALATTVERINQTLESSLSWKGIQLRWEAYRTGVSFGELVMRSSLEYRVEQVFLIHRDTGLPILHVVDPAIQA
jgi:hypothetical protein